MFSIIKMELNYTIFENYHQKLKLIFIKTLYATVGLHLPGETDQ